MISTTEMPSNVHCPAYVGNVQGKSDGACLIIVISLISCSAGLSYSYEYSIINTRDFIRPQRYISVLHQDLWHTKRS
jgi:hypothetical protein